MPILARSASIPVTSDATKRTLCFTRHVSISHESATDIERLQEVQHGQRPKQAAMGAETARRGFIRASACTSGTVKPLKCAHTAHSIARAWRAIANTEAKVRRATATTPSALSDSFSQTPTMIHAQDPPRGRRRAAETMPKSRLYETKSNSESASTTP